MTFGVIRRAAASVGLLGLVPTAVMVVQGYITPVEGGIRAAVTLAAVLLGARVVTRGLLYLAKHPGTRIPETAQPQLIEAEATTLARPSRRGSDPSSATDA
ncbi:MAG: hypothetical protein ACRDKZ_07250 [Actinomycetota bacterium]